jgi:hypothetical protein
MSEHQVYEFLAIDRPLTDAQMGELRALSSRADITATRFWNEFEFLHLDIDLIALAAEASPPERFDDKGFRDWVKGLAVGAKTEWLLRTLDDPTLLLGAELRRTFVQ